MVGEVDRTCSKTSPGPEAVIPMPDDLLRSRFPSMDDHPKLGSMISIRPLDFLRHASTKCDPSRSNIEGVDIASILLLSNRYD